MEKHNLNTESPNILGTQPSKAEKAMVGASKHEISEQTRRYIMFNFFCAMQGVCLVPALQDRIFRAFALATGDRINVQTFDDDFYTEIVGPHTANMNNYHAKMVKELASKRSPDECKAYLEKVGSIMHKTNEWEEEVENSPEAAKFKAPESEEHREIYECNDRIMHMVFPDYDEMIKKEE